MVVDFFAYNSFGTLCSFYNLKTNTDLQVGGEISLYCNGRMYNTKTMDFIFGAPLISCSIEELPRTDDLCFSVKDARNNVFYIKSFRRNYKPVIKKYCRLFELLNSVRAFLQGFRHDSKHNLFQWITDADYHFTEEYLIENISFIYEVINSFDTSYFDGTQPTFWTSYLSNLYHRAKIVTPQPIATSTTLVKEVFESYFNKKIEGGSKAGDGSAPCGVCESCQKPDCGQCKSCRLTLIFSGASTSKSTCESRKCSKISETEQPYSRLRGNRVRVTLYSNKRDFKWIKPPISQQEDDLSYYNEVLIESVVITRGDFVLIQPQLSNKPVIVAKVISFWADDKNNAQFHGHIYQRAQDTILGETGDPLELFVVNSCANFFVKDIICPAIVKYKKVPDNWSSCGGVDNLYIPKWDSSRRFYFRHRYNINNSSFTDIEQDFLNLSEIIECPSCKQKKKDSEKLTPSLSDGRVCWKGEEYSVGCGVFLNMYSNSYKYKKTPTVSDTSGSEFDDEDTYTEYYRKYSDKRNMKKPRKAEPFCVCLIEEISSSPEIRLKVRHFIRPEYTDLETPYNSDELAYTVDLNLVYWTELVTTIKIEEVVGKCFIACKSALNVNPRQWIKGGPLRFYFNEGYGIDEKAFIRYTKEAESIGLGIAADPYPEIQPLRCMDLFSGCGGFTQGLKQSGVCRAKWAVEINGKFSHAYQLNHKAATVYKGDANEFLSERWLNENSEMPSKGEVEMIVSGLPCEDFYDEECQFLNSLVVTCLSYVDYYRPKYFVFESIPKFVRLEESLIFKLVLRAMLAIGYQVTFGILQAGNYGVPQNRKRLIIMASAPGHALPNFPEPLNCFNQLPSNLNITVKGTVFTTGLNWRDSAPYRQLYVEDAILDLPTIENNEIEFYNYEMAYRTEAASHFQRNMRANYFSEAIVIDHLVKRLPDIHVVRIKNIKSGKNRDWRNLPNISVRMQDGRLTPLLQYNYHTKHQKNSEDPRGVCACASGADCGLDDFQVNTLIPWPLPHSADENNNWRGVFGRVYRRGFFETTTVKPDPMGPQGKVVHHTEHRMLSVREWARTQGFPDEYYLFGNTNEKYRQIGQAVPPPLAAALGQEIKKAICNNS